MDQPIDDEILEFIRSIKASEAHHHAYINHQTGESGAIVILYGHKGRSRRQVIEDIVSTANFLVGSGGAIAAAVADSEMKLAAEAREAASSTKH